MIILKYVGEKISGSLFNLYELGLEMLSNDIEVYWHFDNLNVPFDLRYNIVIPILPKDYNISPYDSVISNGFDVFLDKYFNCVKNYFIFCSANFTCSYVNALQKLGLNNFNNKMKKTYLINNNDALNLNFKNVINYKHGMFIKYYNVKLNTINANWYTSTSEYVDNIDDLKYTYVKKTIVDHIKNKYKPLIFDTIETITPFFDYKGYVYIKYIDNYPRIINEFLIFNKSVILESISPGIKKMYKLTEKDIGKDLLNLNINLMFAEFDIQTFKNLIF